MLNSSNRKESSSIANLNTISDGTSIKGVFTSSSDTRVGGVLEGDLKVDGNVFLTEGGSVEGTIQGNTINIAGSMKGDVNARHKVFLASSANVQGSIHADRLVIEEGAIFDGECRMGAKSRKMSTNSVPVPDGKNEKLAKKSA